jgi:hypothetical protein
MLMSAQVRNGSTKNWAMTPKKKPFGFLAMYKKSSHLSSNATPYIITARAMFNPSRSPWEKLSCMESIEVGEAIARKSK